MEQYLELISVPAIATVVYWIVNVLKTAVGEKETFKKFIPLISAGLGVICGIVCYFAFPTIIPAQNIWVAIVLGGASGLTATGTNHVIKQLSKGEKDGESKES